jgi:nicotinamidase-related amidase
MHDQKLRNRVSQQQHTMQTGQSSSSSALMLIDLQMDYVSGGDLLQGQTSPMLAAFPDLPANVEHVLRICRAAGMHVVHVRGQDSAAASKWLPWWTELHGEGAGAGLASPAEPWAAEMPGEPVFVKHTYDAFMSGDASAALLQHLQSLGIKRLYMCGCLTKACVGFSANSAFTLGFEVFVLGNCCADRCKEHHNAYLQMYDGYHLRVMSGRDILSAETRR